MLEVDYFLETDIKWPTSTLRRKKKIGYVFLTNSNVVQLPITLYITKAMTLILQYFKFGVKDPTLEELEI